MQEQIKKQGYKLTKSRLAVLNLLQKKHQPFTAQEIYKKLAKKFDLASVYRILNLFSELKLVQTEKIDNQKYYFISQKHHHHIKCRKCGAIKCVPCNAINIKINNFTNILHQLTLSGICKKCK